MKKIEIIITCIPYLLYYYKLPQIFITHIYIKLQTTTNY
jgi:hypothetical protein